jgi:hypothetical protein
METRITIGNKTWIVPANAAQSLINWLDINAVEVGERREIREVRNDGLSDPRQLITEKDI